MKRICEQCGKEFKTPYPSYGKGKFCSRECANMNMRGENNPRYTKKIIRFCMFCGKEFLITPYQAKKRYGKYCSQECMGKWRSKNLNSENHPNWKGGKLKQICEICGAVFEVDFCHLKRGQGKFCSQECYTQSQIESKKGKNNSQWKGGISFEPYCSRFNNDLKERVREFFDRKCYMCDMTEEENEQRLSVHHVNYDKMVCCNNVPPLFVPLCQRHHGMTNHNQDDWQEFFEVSLQYLTQGKCFYTQEEMAICDKAPIIER